MIAGVAGGIRLDVPERRDVRPTIDRVREATFNALFSLGVIEDARVLDLFAGTGALGIEALSRGAAHAVFVETERATAEVVTANLQRCKLDHLATVTVSDANAWLDRFGNSSPTDVSTPEFDLALLDPPYAFQGWSDLLARVPAELLVVESGRKVDLDPTFEVVRERRYGSTVVSILRAPDSARSTGRVATDLGGDQ